MRNTLGKTVTLEIALSMRKLNQELFIEKLEDTIKQNLPDPDLPLREKKKAVISSLKGYSPAPFAFLFWKSLKPGWLPRRTRLVAQLSQNTNFVMDLTVEEFLRMHAVIHLVENPQTVIEQIILAANHLAGEKFDLTTPVTSLSGGQSRALMIADTAILSSSPIVLIDEIENAGIDRKKALELLITSDKIVLMATHDPLLALMADKRIIIKNGGISKVLDTSEEEKLLLEELEKMDSLIQTARQELRKGSTLSASILDMD
jgi:ABC-type lipoprotein export system ATPase subunit